MTELDFIEKEDPSKRDAVRQRNVLRTLLDGALEAESQRLSDYSTIQEGLRAMFPMHGIEVFVGDRILVKFALPGEDFQYVEFDKGNLSAVKESLRTLFKSTCAA